MGHLLNILEEIHKDLESEKASVAQAIGNAKYAVEKVFSRRKRREDKHASKWDALHEYHRSNGDEYMVNMMNIFKNFSRAAGDPDPAHYFNQLLILVRKSDEAQQQKIDMPFWYYYGKRYCPEWRESYYAGYPEQPNYPLPPNPYEKPEEVLIDDFFAAIKEVEEAIKIRIAQAEAMERAAAEKEALEKEALEKEALEKERVEDPAADLIAGLNQNPILHQQVLEFIRQQQMAVPPYQDPNAGGVLQDPNAGALPVNALPADAVELLQEAAPDASPRRQSPPR